MAVVTPVQRRVTNLLYFTLDSLPIRQNHLNVYIIVSRVWRLRVPALVLPGKYKPDYEQEKHTAGVAYADDGPWDMVAIRVGGQI